MKYSKQFLLTAILSFSCLMAFAQVGIGTETPEASSALDVSSTNKGFLAPRMTTTQRVAIQNPAQGLQVFDTTTKSLWYHDGSIWVDISKIAADDLGNHSATENIKLNGQWLSNDGGNEGVYVATNGRVGIGTSSPGALLDLKGVKSSAVPTLRVEDDATMALGVGGKITLGGKYTSAGNALADATYMEAYKENTSSGNYSFALAFGTREYGRNLTEKMRISASGNVGINTTSPTQKLHVAGNAIVTGTVTAQGSVLTSDRRLKKDIKPLKLGLKELVKVEGKTYNWKDESSSTDLQIGVIAQELEEIFPQLVDTTGEFKAVNYIGLVPIMVEAIKDLNAENRGLKNLLKRLEARVNALEK